MKASSTSRTPTGVLLLNLGTPSAPTPEKVGVYLREFLMDPYVIDIPFVLRWMLVNLSIVPRRKHDSAKLYNKIWTRNGSPLLEYTERLAKGVQEELGTEMRVAACMRYGHPSVPNALRQLRDEGARRVIALPLYPQYSLAATQSSIQAIEDAAETVDPSMLVEILPRFFDAEEYLASVTQVSAKALEGREFDFYLFSFHGLPERQVKKTDPAGEHCLAKANCCETLQAANQDCYRAQCFATARALAARLKIPPSRYEVTFQSRLGRTPWIPPFTDEFYRTLPARGVKRLAVLCPSFVADCLETLEEVNIRGREEFTRCGGEELFLVPSLNDDPVWVRGVASLIRRHLQA